MAFVHLRTHTEYSIVDGALKVDDMVQCAAQDQQPALAITDLNNLFAAVKFYKAARSAGVQPLLGADIWLEAEPSSASAAGDQRQASRLLLLAQNKTGYHNLCELLTAAWTQMPQRTPACVSWSALERHAEGLIALSGADMGAVGQALLQGDEARAASMARALAAIFPTRFYIELQRAALPTNESHVRLACKLAHRLQLPVVATHPIQFAQADDYEAHEARVCIADGEVLTNPRRVKRFSKEQYFRTQDEMRALFADLPSAVANTMRIAQRCALELQLGQPQLPDFPTSPIHGQTVGMEEYFRHLAQVGLQERLEQLYPDAQERERRRQAYQQRLDFEIATILKMGFPGYFLIVADFINWAKSHGCPVGPGRGSGAGSLVAYALKITDLDPLRYNLLFERFLNPERVSMPDFDVDFCQANRDRVIDYVKDKYGREAVSQIATFGTMAAKAALRDVGRVLGMGYGHVDSVAKLVPAPPGKTVTLKRPGPHPDPGVVYARIEAPEIEQREAKEEEVAELLALAERVEGTVRNVGMHAGGVLIAPGKITDFCPLYMQPGSDSAVSQFDKDDVETIGLVKFDFLGLATLTILEQAKDLIVARHADQQGFDFARIPLDDRATFDLLSEGKTVAVFQLESRGMQGMLRDAKPSVFEDIIALVALYRPGPMDLIPSFCARKHGREPVQYPHPLMQEVLQETYGIMVYQEQVMQVAQRLGGYSLGGADLLRRAMGKKKADEMATHRAIFAEGAAKNNIPAAKANEIFDLMEKFAGYGFNKSHAAAYALLAYHTAWLKAHYTAEFFAANMSVSIDDTDKLKIFYDDATQNFGLVFEPPNINTGVFRFEPVDDKHLRYGLGAIKGTGQGAIEAIVAEREAKGPFKSLFDLCARVDKSRVNKRVIEALIKAGALDCLHENRAALMASVGLAFDYAETLAANADQSGLFDFSGDEGPSHASSTQEPNLVAAQAWGIKERLTIEKTALGYYLSGHLFDQAEHEVRRIAPQRIVDLREAREPQLCGGIVSDLRFVNGQRGRVAIFRLDDKTDLIEAVANEDLWQQHKDTLKDDELLIVRGKVQPDRFSGGRRLNVQQIWSLPEARCEFGRYLRVQVNGHMPPVAELLKDFPPLPASSKNGALGLSVRLLLQRQSSEVSAQAELDLGAESCFFPSDTALERWRQAAHGHQAEVVYS